MYYKNIEWKLASIKLVLMDVDGVLTNGQIIYDSEGHEIKEFNVRDGLGIRFLLKSGIDVGIITGRHSKALTHRCHDLGITYLKDSVKNKSEALIDLLEEVNILENNTIFIGDDLYDIPAMIRVGLSVAVADADKEVLRIANIVTSKKGGKGAVREIAEMVLKSKGVWKKIIEQFFK